MSDGMCCSGRLWSIFSGLVVCLLAAPGAAHAQWYIGGDLGGNYTQTATVSINQPATGTAVDFHDVQFSARPFKSPQYYVWRAGRLFGESRRFGLEFEFTHLKVIAATDRTYHATGSIDGVTVDESVPMDILVQRYAMTHGLNFLLINFVNRLPLGATRFTLVTRAGAGATLPHAETTIDDVDREQYQFAGPGAKVEFGVAFRLFHALSLSSAYKLSVARPLISIADGTGRMLAVTHQISGGVLFGF